MHEGTELTGTITKNIHKIATNRLSAKHQRKNWKYVPTVAPCLPVTALMPLPQNLRSVRPSDTRWNCDLTPCIKLKTQYWHKLDLLNVIHSRNGNVLLARHLLFRLVENLPLLPMMYTLT